eukprot:6214674-Pleurochrysis_carterae.AAC.2
MPGWSVHNLICTFALAKRTLLTAPLQRPVSSILTGFVSIFLESIACVVALSGQPDGFAPVVSVSEAACGEDERLLLFRNNQRKRLKTDALKSRLRSSKLWKVKLKRTKHCAHRAKRSAECGRADEAANDGKL